MRAARPLDILYVGMLPPHPGGSGISWSQVLGGLAERGYTVRALAPITLAALDAGDGFVAAHPELNVTRFLVPHFYTGPNIPASAEYRALERVQIEAKMGALIEQRRPDVVISGRETFALHVPELAGRHSLPCLQGIRGNTAIAIVNGSYPLELASELLAQFRKASLLVSVARHLADGLGRFGIGGIRVIPNSVDLAQFSSPSPDAALRRELGVQDDDVVVVHASNLKAAKRPLDLVSSAARALRRNPRLLYVVVGDGTHRSDMEAACQESGIAGRFRFVGWVDYARMPSYLGLADLVVMPSQTEGLSRVYLEAQASAKALLASDIPPAREVIADGETGCLFRVGDVDDLADTTVRLAGDRELRHRIGVNARERVRAHSLPEVVAAYASILEECVRLRAGTVDRLRDRGGSAASDVDLAGTRFIVLTTPRSGSTWFVDVLNQLPATAAYTELFLARRKPRAERAMSWNTAAYLDDHLRGHRLFCETAGRLGARPWSVVAYLNELYRRPGAVGFKVMYENLVRFPELWAYVLARRLRVVHLVRANLLDVVVSEQVRWTTGTVHRVVGEPENAIEPIRIDPGDLVKRIRRMRARTSVMRGLLRACRVAHLEVTYETLVGKPEAFGPVCDFLSIDRGDRMPWSQLDKLVKRPHSEIIQNYDEVERVLDAAGVARTSGHLT